MLNKYKSLTIYNPYNMPLTIYTDLRCFEINFPAGKFLRQADIVFRCYIFEICKTLKEYNIILKTISGKEVEVHDVIKKGVDKVYIFSRAGNHITTQLNVSSFHED